MPQRIKEVLKAEEGFFLIFDHVCVFKHLMKCCTLTTQQT